MTRRLASISPLWAILGCALLLRILLPSSVLALRHDPSVFVQGDTPDYVRPAEAMLISGAFDGDRQPEIERTPGYPVFLMPGLIAGRLATVTIALQICLSTLTVVFVYLTSKLLFSRKKAYWSAALYAVEPLSVIYCSLILSETLFTFLVVLFVYQTACYMKQGKLPILLPLH
jgi:4-amino-4-deoxy-L-arabinose transferase-like glycosyltransferase